MSLRPGINPLDRRMQPGMRTMEVRDQHYSFPSAEELSKKMDARQRVAERTRTAMEFRDNMARGIPAAPGMGLGMAMTGGFDASDLMKNPEMAQKSTRDQAEKVSEPYRRANMMAAEKTNPMNAASQNPGREFLMDYLNNPGERILIPKR